jgi:zinc-ribbon domain
MQASFCPGCGAAVVPGAQFCAYCGTALPGGSPVAPLPSPETLAPPALASSGPAYPMAPPPPPPPPRHRTLVLVVVIVVVLLVVGVIAFALLAPPAPAVSVQSLVVWAPDNVCGLNANPSFYDGFNGSTGQVQTFGLEIPNYNTTGSCTLRSVTTNTTGFSLTVPAGALPLTVAADQNGTLNVTLTSPSSPFEGVVNLVYA